MFVEAVRLALQAIFRNALRSFLTVLGVVIGVAAVIAMVTVGQGSTEQVAADVGKLGTNLLVVRPGQARQGPQAPSPNAPSFDMGDVAALEMMNSVGACQGNASALATLEQKIEATIAQCTKPQP